MGELRLGTRGSELARWQAEHVAARLCRLHPGLRVEIEVIRTTGDRIRDRPLAAIGGKGLFLKEIEEALLSGAVDLAVHSLKDVPADLAGGCRIGAVLERQDPFDVLCLAPGNERRRPTGASGSGRKRGAGAPTTESRRSPAGERVAELEAGTRIGTSSLRRATQLLAIHPRLAIDPLRGNVDTRLRKLDAGEVDAIVLAAAGLARLGLQQRGTLRFEANDMIPAVGQGALCVEVRESESDRAAASVAALEHAPTRVAVTAERAFMRAVGGSCRVPMGAHAALAEDGSLELTAFVGDARGNVVRGRAEGAAGTAEELGAELAGSLLDRGGAELLAGVDGLDDAGPGEPSSLSVPTEST